jgi:hypothetical protein
LEKKNQILKKGKKIKNTYGKTKVSYEGGMLMKITDFCQDKTAEKTV